MRTRTHARRFAALAAAALLMLGAAGARADVQLECHLGYNDTVTFLRTIPFTARVTSDGGDVNGVLQLDVQRYNTIYDRYEQPVVVASGATVEASMPVKLTYRQSAYTVRWVEGDRVVAETELKPAAFIDPRSLIIGVLSDSDKSLSQHEVTQTADPLRRAEYLRTIKLNERTFPADAESMRAFDILMVDGFDISMLSAERQAALDGWLMAGGVVILGGGAQATSAFPYFTRYTGISAGALTDGGDVSETLLALFKSTEKPLGGSVRLVALAGAKGASVGGDTPLVDIADCGEGSVLTCAFSLSDAPFADWQGRFALWQRMLLEYRKAAYDRALKEHSGDTYRYQNYVGTDVTGQIEIPNSEGMALPVAILAVFVLLVGFGSYLLLKRFDKREWMWLTVPALALAFSLALWGVSGVLDLQRPVAASYTVLRIAEDGAKDVFTGVSTTSARVGRFRLSAVEGTVDTLAENSYYYDGSNDKQGEKELRYVYRGGAEPNVEMPGDLMAWEQINFAVNDAPLADCSVSGECKLDGDALAFAVTNNGAIALEPGLIVTDYGYVTTSRVLPGQTIAARLTPKPKTMAGNQQLEDGVLLDEASRGRFSYYDCFSSFYGKQRENPEISQEIASLQYSMLNYLTNGNAWNTGSSRFHYVTFAEGLCEPQIIVDGEVVRRDAHYGIVDVGLSYDPISDDGSVRFLNGSFPAYDATLDQQHKPVLGMVISGGMYSYYQLNNNNPVFGYDLRAVPDGMTLTRLSLRPTYAYYSYAVSFYNAKTGAWDDVIEYTHDPNKGTGDERVNVKDIKPYIGDDGMLYAQFRKLVDNGDYAEIATPALTMDGRMK